MSRGLRVLSCGSSGVPAVFAHFMALSVSHRAATPTLIAYPHGLPIVRYLDWFFRHVGYLVLCFSRRVCVTYAAGCSVGSCNCIAQCCRGGGFFPSYAVFLVSLGISVMVSGIFALALLFLGCACGVAFSLRIPIPLLSHRLRFAGLRGFFAADVLTGCPCGCVTAFLGRRSCVFFLSSCSARGRLLLSLFLVLLLCLFLRHLRFSAACPAAGCPYGVTHPFWLQLPVLLLRWSYVCWVCGV